MGVVSDDRKKVIQKILHLYRHLSSVFKCRQLYFTEFPIFSFKHELFGIVDAVYVSGGGGDVTTRKCRSRPNPSSNSNSNSSSSSSSDQQQQKLTCDLYEWKYSQKSSIQDTINHGFNQLFLLRKLTNFKVNNLYVGIFDYNLNFYLLRFTGVHAELDKRNWAG